MQKLFKLHAHEEWLFPSQIQSGIRNMSFWEDWIRRGNIFYIKHWCELLWPSGRFICYYAGKHEHSEHAECHHLDCRNASLGTKRGDKELIYKAPLEANFSLWAGRRSQTSWVKLHGFRAKRKSLKVLTQLTSGLQRASEVWTFIGLHLRTFLERIRPAAGKQTQEILEVRAVCTAIEHHVLYMLWRMTVKEKPTMTGIFCSKLTEAKKERVKRAKQSPVPAHLNLHSSFMMFESMLLTASRKTAAVFPVPHTASAFPLFLLVYRFD